MGSPWLIRRRAQISPDVPHQVGLTAIAPVRHDALDDLRRTLEEIGTDPAANRLLPFGQLEGTHFARFFLMEPTSDPQGRPIPAQLVFMADWDAPLEDRLRQLAEVGRPGLDRLFCNCEGYAEAGSNHNDAVISYLRKHAVRDSAYYVNTVGLSVVEILTEAKLRDRLEQYLDAYGQRSQSPAQLRTKVLEWIASTDLHEVLRPVIPPSLRWRLGELLHMIAVPAIGLVFAPLILPALPLWLIGLRHHEKNDPAPDILPDPSHVAQLEAIEDLGPINQFTAVGFIKPGWFRAATARIVLFLISYGVRHIFNRADLAGVKTIHFARWTFLDNGRRVIFASNYDGSLESYMDDFIDKVAWGLNAVFSNGVGYPTTSWLLFGGARNETPFKHYLRVHQVPTQVWYTPYQNLTALNIANNSAIRNGLREGASEVEATCWLRRL